MTILDEKTLDSLLASVRAPEMPAGLPHRILHGAVPVQKQSVLFWQVMADSLRDIFGSPGDVPFYNAKWRIAGALAALLLGFSTGYFSGSSPDEEDVSYYAIYDTEESDVI